MNQFREAGLTADSVISDPCVSDIQTCPFGEVPQLQPHPLTKLVIILSMISYISSCRATVQYSFGFISVPVLVPGVGSVHSVCYSNILIITWNNHQQNPPMVHSISSQYTYIFL